MKVFSKPFERLSISRLKDPHKKVIKILFAMKGLLSQGALANKQRNREDEVDPLIPTSKAESERVIKIYFGAYV